MNSNVTGHHDTAFAQQSWRGRHGQAPAREAAPMSPAGARFSAPGASRRGTPMPRKGVVSAQRRVDVMLPATHAHVIFAAAMKAKWPRHTAFEVCAVPVVI